MQGPVATKLSVFNHPALLGYTVQFLRNVRAKLVMESVVPLNNNRLWEAEIVTLVEFGCFCSFYLMDGWHLFNGFSRATVADPLVSIFKLIHFTKICSAKMAKFEPFQVV